MSQLHFFFCCPVTVHSCLLECAWTLKLNTLSADVGTSHLNFCFPLKLVPSLPLFILSLCMKIQLTHKPSHKEVLKSHNVPFSLASASSNSIESVYQISCRTRSVHPAEQSHQVQISPSAQRCKSGWRCLHNACIRCSQRDNRWIYLCTAAAGNHVLYYLTFR